MKMYCDDYLRKSIGVIFCECGEEILVLPYLEEMTRCIQSHAEMHKSIQTSKKNGKKEYERIEEQLTQKVLLKIVGFNYDNC